MASDQRKRALDQSTRAALKGLDSILAEMAEDELKPGEFTARQAHERHKAGGGRKTFDSISRVLSRKAKNGELVSRQIVLTGRVTNAYRVP